MNVLVTGGAGFIGSHTVVELMQAGHSPVIVDDFINSNPAVIENIEKITGKACSVINLDVRDTVKLAKLMDKYEIDSVIHFAALKAVGESVQKPLLYYQNNLGSLLSVLDAMLQKNITNLIFSSSAVVYGDPDEVPITEDAKSKPPTNPYGATKQMAEQIIRDIGKSSNIKAVLLRYFNPIGAHASGLIGELPIGVPNNLVPFVAQTAAGIRDKLTVFGDDYDTADGSGVRDYIHVVDLAKAHVKALDYLEKSADKETILNLGTGTGVSVLEVIKTFEHVNGVIVPFQIGPRRPGDIAACYASPAKAEKLLGWKAELSIEDALRDTWRWQKHIGETK